ncbi:chorismate mutase [Streptacidiphilus sp. P02-A3a]|uniref:chorismate mutase n=1 Tax=Streptacidiphilus sp. P02-A3a TaxID=2704468 RepID=UPI0015F9C132|nr:chorismate mutase [Streptacidiphilus sp. P02-A3a]QMU72677.1 chorismate mutase [Streptacidiphilus sp. P02-A3a]
MNTQSAAAPVARTTVTEAAEVIAAARIRIDALDQRVIELVRQRMAVSAEVQAARIGSGGNRVALNREMEILARYREALGPQGTEVAMQLLELCRGRA